MNKENENNFKVPLHDIENLQAVETRPILKNSTRTNLIAFSPEEKKHLKVTFQTPLKTPKVSPGRYDLIRVLDDDENWIERTSVLTRQDHEDYLLLARQILEDLVTSLPINSDSTNSLKSSESSSDILLSEEQLALFDSPTPSLEDIHIENKTLQVEEPCQRESPPVVSLSEESLPFFDSPATPWELTESSKSCTSGPAPVVALSEETLLLCESTVSVKSAKTEPSQTSDSSGRNSEPVKMDGDENEIPVSKGSYNIDFDSLDLESMNPFATKTKVKMGSSPPKSTVESMEVDLEIEENPFGTKTKMRNSPPPVVHEEENPLQTKPKMRNLPPPVMPEVENPFQTQTKVASSPRMSRASLDVDSLMLKKFSLTPTGSDDEPDTADPLKDLARVSSESPTRATTDINDNDSDKTPFQTATDDSSDIAQEPPKPSPKKKTGSAKKIPARKSKFTKPAFVNKNDNDGADIVIFEPKKNPPAEATDEIEIFEPKSRSSAERESGNDSENPSAPTSHTSSRSGSHQREIPSSEDELGNLPQPNIPEPDFDPLAGFTNEDDGVKGQAIDGSDDFGFDEDDFRPATEVFNDLQGWQMLENQGSRNEETDTLLSRQSLYVKFDPLVKSRGRGEKSLQLDKKPATDLAVTNVKSEENDDLLQMNTPPPSKSLTRLKHPASRVLENSANKQKDVDRLFAYSPEQSQDLVFIPEMWVDHLNSFSELEDSAVLSQDSLECLSCTWVQENGRPDSPLAFDHEEILCIDDDRDPSDSGCAESGSPTTRQEPLGSASDDGLVKVLKYSEYEWVELKKQLDLDVRSRLLVKERDFDDQKKQLESEAKELKVANAKLKTSLTDMQKIVTEYERTISQVITDKEHVEKNSQSSIGDLVRERNQAVEDLQSMDSAFADLLRRNNKLKEAAEAFKKNEETLKECVSHYQAKVKKHEQRYAGLKQHAQEKLQSANEEIEKITKTKNSDITRLHAAVKKSELQVQSLQSSLDQKIKENVELTKICDDLLKQV